MNNETDNQHHGEIIIVKRVMDDHDEHHGGVWKIAFADFMTAMMAFFLVMWLINASNEETKKAVASYFNPIKLMDRRSNPKGVRNPKYGTAAENEKAPEDETTVITSPTAAPISGQGVAETFEEQALFSDPYALLVEIAAGVDQRSDTHETIDQSQTGNTVGMGLSGGVAFQDPFDPKAWSLNFGNQREADAPANSASETDMEIVETNTPKKMPVATPSISKPVAEALDYDPNFAKSETEDNIEKQTQSIREAANQIINSSGPKAPKVEIISDGQGTLITLSDHSQSGMFNIGSARPSPELVRVMARIGEILAGKKGMVAIAGHTDGRKYNTGEYDNWRLSTARAHMAYHMLVRGGLDRERVERIEGHAAMKLVAPDNPYAAINRRIELYLRSI